MQVDPIKPMLKAPTTERLKLKNDELLSSFTFKSNLRRYNQATGVEDGEQYVLKICKDYGDAEVWANSRLMAGRHQLNPKP